MACTLKGGIRWNVTRRQTCILSGLLRHRMQVLWMGLKVVRLSDGMLSGMLASHHGSARLILLTHHCRLSSLLGVSLDGNLHGLALMRNDMLLWMLLNSNLLWLRCTTLSTTSIGLSLVL